MTNKRGLLSVAALVVGITFVQARAELPYNPNFLIHGPNSKVYQFSPDSSPQFSVSDITNSLSSSDIAQSVTSSLPFLTYNSRSFAPVVTDDGITVFSGACSEDQQELELWTYGFEQENNTWTQMRPTLNDQSLSANFLSATFIFPSTMPSNHSIYVFGGMCSRVPSNVSTWTSSATYSNTMLTITQEANRGYSVGLTSQRGPPIPEAGLTVTPLVASTLRSKRDALTQQQNFVLIGGHTQNAFINMSQIAMFSLPQQSWSFIGINQPLATVVEPRSGHSAVLSLDGSKIFVYGGWVGDVTNPAQPQLAILEVGQGYGGNGSWMWTVPNQIGSPITSNQGLYGHAALMLPGGVMMVSGGRTITKLGDKVRRNTRGFMFYNTTSSMWMDSYTNPESVTKTQKPGTRSHFGLKVGLGAGLSIGLVSAVFVLLLALWVLHRTKRRRRTREKELREMALGTDRGHSVTEFGRPDSRLSLTGGRSPGWSAGPEQSVRSHSQFDHRIGAVETGNLANARARAIGRSRAYDVPSPTRGLRKSLHSRGPTGTNYMSSTLAVGAISRIDEEEEERSQRGSMKRRKTDTSQRPPSDPFKDPPALQQREKEAEKRRAEVATWVEDWASAAESLQLSRSPSKATGRTYSNLSGLQSSSSGDKSDRSNSNLSETSNYSNLSAHKSVIRTFSQRSGSAGYALFSTAAAAMGRLAGRPDPHASNIERSPSKRAVSTGDLAQLAAKKRRNSTERQSQPILHARPGTRVHTTVTSHEHNASVADLDYYTPPESPIKDYKKEPRQRSNSLTNTSRKAIGVLGQATKRVFSGTNNASIHDKVTTIESHSGHSSPTKHSTNPEMAQITPRRVSSTGTSFWQRKQGARDWEDDGGPGESSGTIRRRSGRVMQPEELSSGTSGSGHSDDWDVETAVQQRVVQVMFTVPKEKLRVVNADNLSLISRSDTNASHESDTEDITKRMSTVEEAGYEEDSTSSGIATGSQRLHSDSTWKGKEPLQLPRQRSGDTIGKAL